MLAACGGGKSSDNASAGDPEKLYKQNCSTCHGGNLEGNIGPALNNIGSELSKEDIEKIIAEGKGSMPSGIIKGEDASAVAEWLSEKNNE